MRISDWSSDVCSSDLLTPLILARASPAAAMRTSAQWPAVKGSIRQHAGSLCCRWMEDASPLKGGSRNRSGGLRLFRRFPDHAVHFDDAHTVFHLPGATFPLPNVLARSEGRR